MGVIQFWMRQMMETYKLLGLCTGLLGILAMLCDRLGWFRDQDKKDIAETICRETEGIPRDTRGFEKFLAAFPPADGVAPTTVSHITKDVIQTHDKFPVSITVRYIADGQRTKPVASYQDVRRWAKRTRYGCLPAGRSVAKQVVVVVVALRLRSLRLRSLRLRSGSATGSTTGQAVRISRAACLPAGRFFVISVLSVVNLRFVYTPVVLNSPEFVARES